MASLGATKTGTASKAPCPSKASLKSSSLLAGNTSFARRCHQQARA